MRRLSVPCGIKTETKAFPFKRSIIDKGNGAGYSLPQAAAQAKRELRRLFAAVTIPRDEPLEVLMEQHLAA